MKQIAEFTIVGRVGKVKPGNALRVTIASNYRFLDQTNEWKDDTHWNEVTVFNKARAAEIEESVGPGDLVEVRGRLRQGSYKRQDGSTAYTVDLIATRFELKAKAESRAREKEAA